jgi:hypothetical protein
MHFITIQYYFFFQKKKRSTHGVYWSTRYSQHCIGFCHTNGIRHCARVLYYIWNSGCSKEFIRLRRPSLHRILSTTQRAPSPRTRGRAFTCHVTFRKRCVTRFKAPSICVCVCVVVVVGSAYTGSPSIFGCGHNAWLLKYHVESGIRPGAYYVHHGVAQCVGAQYYIEGSTLSMELCSVCGITHSTCNSASCVAFAKRAWAALYGTPSIMKLATHHTRALT